MSLLDCEGASFDLHSSNQGGHCLACSSSLRSSSQCLRLGKVDADGLDLRMIQVDTVGLSARGFQNRVPIVSVLSVTLLVGTI